MAIGKIKGPMLYDNLERQGVDLSFDGNLLYLDVTTRRLGVGTNTPQYGLDVPANVKLANLTVLGNTITSNTGKIGFGSISSLVVTGGDAYNVILTDGAGNLRFGTLDEISGNTNFTGNTIELGANTSGKFISNALSLTSADSITNAIAELNEILGNITNSTGTEIHVSGNINSTNVDTQTVYATDIYGTLQTPAQPNVTTVGHLQGLVIDGNLTVNGNTTFLGYSDLTISDSILNLHTTANLAPYTSNDGKDIGIKMHYYDTQDSHAALIRANDSGYLEWYSRGVEIDGNTFVGNAYGVIKTGELLLANATPTTGANTGALQVYGGTSIGGNLYVAENITANTITVPGFSSTAGNVSTLYVANFSTGNAVISGGYISALANAAITYGNITTIDAVTIRTENFSAANAVITSGYADNYAIGANTAATGRFTTITTTNVATVGGNLVANSGTASNNVTTGALVVTGGAGISGNLHVGNIVVDQINATTGMINNFYSLTSDIGDTVANTATIGNLVFADTTVTHSNVFVFNSDSAIQVPVGDTSQRPAGVNGYLRYNTDTPALEYFDGSIWVPVTNTVTDQLLTGDGVNDTFTLTQEATAIGVIVSINGTLQQPNSSYTIHDGNQITFTEIPESTDIIDVRFLGAAVTINSTLSDDLSVSGNILVGGNVTLSGILSAPQITKAADSAGTIGQICWDDEYIYVCTATNTWKRSALTGGY